MTSTHIDWIAAETTATRIVDATSTAETPHNMRLSEIAAHTILDVFAQLGYPVDSDEWRTVNRLMAQATSRAWCAGNDRGFSAGYQHGVSRAATA